MGKGEICQSAIDFAQFLLLTLYIVTPDLRLILDPFNRKHRLPHDRLFTTVRVVVD